MSRITSCDLIESSSSMNTTSTTTATTAGTTTTDTTDASENITQSVQPVDQPILLLVTANIGSIFDSPDLLLNSWTSNFLSSVQSFKPHLVALHCQEVGGKDYQESMKNVNLFVKSLLKSEQLIDFDRALIFLDEDFTSTEKFTALGNLYFIHESISDCQIWDFEEKKFSPLNGRQIFTGNIEKVTLKEKDKFPVKLFPECKWSRKGFMRTRWSFSGAQFDLINIHLFHDASNLTAMKDEALDYTLDRIENDEFDSLPFFIFGDFNFRLDTGSVIKRITNNVSPRLVQSAQKGNIEQMLYENSMQEDPFLTIGKKVFDLINQEDTFYSSSNHQWLLEYDHELDSFKHRLYEFPIDFPPSYPFTEDACGHTYMKTRCPAWCDRVLASYSALPLIFEYSQSNNVNYRMVGPDSPMGDHKPILLSFRLEKPGKTENEVKINGDGPKNVHTSSGPSKSVLDEASGDHLTQCKGIRLRTFSTPVQFHPKSNLTCDTNSRVNIKHKVLFRRNNSLVSNVIGDFENVSIHSKEWAAQRQSFLRLLAEAKSRKISQTVEETASSHTHQVASQLNSACEDVTTCHVANTSIDDTPTPTTPTTPPDALVHNCPTPLAIVERGHHSSSSEDEEWHAHLQWLRQQEGAHKCETFEQHEVNEIELKSHDTLTPSMFNSVPASQTALASSVTQQNTLTTPPTPPHPTACYSADSGASMAQLATINTCPPKSMTQGPVSELLEEKNASSPTRNQATESCSGKKHSNKCPGCTVA